MKSSNLLNVLINVFYFILLSIGVVITCLTVYTMIFQTGLIWIGNNTMVSVYGDRTMEGFMTMDYIKIVIVVSEIILFMKTIYHLRRAILRMINSKIFNSVGTKSLKLICVTMIIYNIVNLFREQFENIVGESLFLVELDFNSLGLFTFVFTLGLFFMLLSNVIKNGITFKNENELTI